MMAERGVAVDHVTLYRWVQRYAPELEKRVRWYQGYRSSSWRVDETYVRVGGKWKYLFRAVDKQGRLIDFMLSDRRNTKAARRFLAKALKVMRNCPPVSITTDKLGSYPKALPRLKRKGELKDTVRHRTSKYLNNRIEADHGALKRHVLGQRLKQLFGPPMRFLRWSSEARGEGQGTWLFVLAFSDTGTGALRPFPDVKFYPMLVREMKRVNGKEVTNDPET
jgi:transposase-like protein